MQPLGYEDKANIEQTIDDEILKRTGISFRSSSVHIASEGNRISVEGELTLAGETRPIAFDLAVRDGRRLSGRVVVTQSNWGMTPYSALFGALKVSDDVEVAIEATLPSGREASAFAYEELAPRELKPALLELDGISRMSVLAHYELYERYVRERNEIIEQRDSSELRAAKVDLSFAIGGIRNHELYFEHLGGESGNPAGAIGRLIERDFGSGQAWRADLKVTALASRGWAWTAYDWDEARLFNYLGDAENAFPVWNATPLIALDVHEHAYVLDFGTDREAYIDAFFANLDWGVVNDWVWQHQIPLKA